MSEDAARVATSTIEALKSSPSCLTAILFACLMALLTYFAMRDEQTQMHERQMLVLKKCFYDHEETNAGKETH